MQSNNTLNLEDIKNGTPTPVEPEVPEEDIPELEIKHKGFTYDAKQLMNQFNEYRAYKEGVMRDWRLIRSLYRGDFWNIFNKHLKDYSLNPDWNYLEYTVQAYLNSVYAGAFIGTLTPCYSEDEQAVEKLNAFIQYNWNKWGMKNKFLHVGEDGELYNLGAVRIDWDQHRHGVIIKDISPDEIYIDPNVSNYMEGDALFIERSVNINILYKNPENKSILDKYKREHKKITDKTINHKIAGHENRQTNDSQQVSLIEAFIRNENGDIDQIFILDESIILEERLNLGLPTFPIAIYQPQRPDGNPYGRSKLFKILNTAITLNLLDSMEATQPYRLLNRVRLVNVDGRINMRSFSEYGNTPGASFEVKGDPNGLIKYIDVPELPDLTNIKNRLENSIFQVTGVDAYYKGRMTNSIQTTGATQAFQARVTMLTDNSRITMLEEFCEHITRIIIEMYRNYSGGHIYNVPTLAATGTNKVIKNTMLNFADDVGNRRFDYMINASTLLPMNQANLFESAKVLYEMQGQYQFKTPVITEEDLVRYSDFPQKDLILQRITKSKMDSTAETLVADLTNFASIFSRLLANGLTEEQAAAEAINMLIEEKNAQMEDPSLGRGFQ